ncbi:hypothetical protein [Tenacibaculum xiamenense]|uniref:hypothetical protein n=1 Tax=Tenacibaculum xiamenense TaxID=1261553 RepID=UPI0038939939
MKKKIVLIVVMSFFLMRCSYDFTPDNFIDLEQPINDTNYINLVNFNNLDTINNQKVMRYYFQSPNNQSTIESKVYVDNRQINAYFSGQSGTFILRPQTYDDGIHNIRIEHKFSSGSGSIADQAGLETLTEIASYQFFVKRLPSSPPPIENVEITDGTIYVKWSTDYERDFTNAYLSLKFKTREIKIPLSNDQLALGTYNDQSTVLFEGSSRYSNFDEYSSVSYSILFESDYGQSYGSPQSLSYDPSSITLEVSFLNFNSYKLTWSAHPLYSNFENFEFFFGGEFFLGSSSGGEYSISSPYIIGSILSPNIRPKVNNFEIQFEFYISDDFPLANSNSFGLANLNPLFLKEIVYHPSTNNFYALIVEDRSVSEYHFRIYEYSFEMDLLRTSNLISCYRVHESLNITINPDDNNIHIDTYNYAYEMDISTLQIIDQYTDTLSNSKFIYRGNILARTDYSNNQVTLTNVTNNTVIYSAPYNFARFGYLSNNGKYILIYTNSENKLYRIDNNQLVEVFDFSNINFSLEIYGDNLFYASSNEVFFVDLINNTRKSFSFGATQQKFQFDSSSNKLLVYQSDRSAIYNILTEDIVRFQFEPNKSARGLFNQEDRDYLVRLGNDRLIHTRGIYIDLN